MANQKLPSLKQAIQIVVSAGLLLAAIYFIDWTTFRLAISNANPFYYIPAVLFTLSRNWFSAYRCQILLSAVDRWIPLSFHVRWYFISFFYNIFLPSTVGGDVARGYALNKQGVNISKAAAVLLFERYLGLFAFILIALASYPLSSYFLTPKGKQTFLILSVALVCMVLIYLFSLYLLPRGKVENKKSGGKINLAVNEFLYAWQLYKNHYKVIGIALLFSTLCHVSKFFSIYYLSQSLHLNLSFIDCIFVFSAIEILCMIPITFNGVGLREVSFLFYLVDLGVSKEHAFLLSILATSLLVILGIVGLLLHLKQINLISGKAIKIRKLTE